MNGSGATAEMGEIRKNLLLEQAIDRRLDALVREAGKRVYLLHDDLAMRENQIRNVLNVALSTSSMMVVTNFIRYQMGRSQAWIHNRFGQKVIEDIENGIVSELADEVANEVYSEIQECDKKKIRTEAHLRLMRLYLGYLNRWFYYSSKMKDEGYRDIAAITEEAVENV